MNGSGRDTQLKIQCASCCLSDQQCTDQARSGSIGDTVDIAALTGSLFQALVEQRDQFPDMVTRSDFGNHAAVLCVNMGLGIQGIRHQALFAIVDGNAGFIAGSFNTQNAQNFNPVKAS